MLCIEQQIANTDTPVSSLSLPLISPPHTSPYPSLNVNLANGKLDMVDGLATSIQSPPSSPKPRTRLPPSPLNKDKKRIIQPNTAPPAEVQSKEWVFISNNTEEDINRHSSYITMCM